MATLIYDLIPTLDQKMWALVVLLFSIALYTSIRLICNLKHFALLSAVVTCHILSMVLWVRTFPQFLIVTVVCGLVLVGYLSFCSFGVTK